MRVQADDLIQQLTEPSGACFQRFIFDLVLAEARTCRIPLHQIHCDLRVIIGDGGRDIVVHARNSRRTHWIPRERSIWSIKSGENGSEVSGLRAELRNSAHGRLREMIAEGYRYVWCTLQHVAQTRKDDFATAARALEEEFHWPADTITFRWIETTTEVLNSHPNLIAVHVPGCAHRLVGVMTRSEWERHAGPAFEVPWVNFGNRNDLRRRIRAHFSGQESPNLLHIAGFSGIGKSRLVFEACRDETGTDEPFPELGGILYFPRAECLTPEVYRYLEADGRQTCLVVDEVPLADVESIEGQIRHHPDRIRLVTIGPAAHMDRERHAGQDLITLLPPPRPEEDGLAFVRAAGPELPEDVLRSLAEASGHDLRLAYLLVVATRRNPQVRGLPVVNLDGILQRLLSLYRPSIGNTDQFLEAYSVLTSSIDVGRAADYRRELVQLASFFGVAETLLDRAIRDAQQCGLGTCTERFFEAGPRALAVRLFVERIWELIVPRLHEFMDTIPPRLQRRFLERCQECSGPARGRIEELLAGYFLGRLMQGGVRQLIDRESSRLFQTWAEFDPLRGLEWLRRVAEQATREDLLALHGEPDWSGGWHGRRQVVWLCQHLAAFAEHFCACEAILFRLALVETEPSIGNNSIAVWQSLFWPVFAATQTPFAQRYPVLLARLADATAETLPLLLAGVLGMMDRRMAGLPLPPRVVGGRLVPEPWRPQSRQEVVDLVSRAGRETLTAIEALAQPFLDLALGAVIDHLDDFYTYGLLPELCQLLSSERLPPSLRRRLLGRLEAWIALLQEVQTGPEQESGNWTSLLNWRAELTAQDLVTAIQDLTAQDVWIAPRAGLERYEELARQLLACPLDLAQLEAWFDSVEAKSGSAFALVLGRLDRNGLFANTIQGWLARGVCIPLVANYLRGLSGGQLPETWAAILDAVLEEQPTAVAAATLAADPSSRGYGRLRRILDRDPLPTTPWLSHFVYVEWEAVLTSPEKGDVLQRLEQRAIAGDPRATPVALDLVAGWGHQEHAPLPTDSGVVLLPMLRRVIEGTVSADSYSWEQAARRLLAFRRRDTLQLLVDTLVLCQPGSMSHRDAAMWLLIEEAANQPGEVMEVIGAAMLTPKVRGVFRALRFEGLFEAIELAVLQGWVQQHGRDMLRYIARHLPSPSLDSAGQPVIPPHTAWFFEEAATDEDLFRAYCAGRHEFEIRRAPTQTREEFEREMEPYLRSPQPRVRDWARYELDYLEMERGWHRQLDEECERK